MLLELLLEKSNEQNEKVEDEAKEGEEEKETEKIKTDFKFEIFAKLEDHLIVAVQHLKQVEENNAQQVANLSEPFASGLMSKSLDAGTFQLSQKEISSDPSESSILPDDETFKKQRREWGRFLMSQFTDLKVQVEIARYGFLASTANEEIKKLTHEFFRDTFYLPFEKGVKATQAAVKEIGELKPSDSVEKKLSTLRDKLTDELDENLLAPIKDVDKIMAPVGSIQDVLSDLQAESRRFSDELHLARKRESNYPVPSIEMDVIRWQSLAARFMNEEAVKKLDPSIQQFDQLVAKAIATAEESVQVVDVNLQAASESTSKEVDPGPEESIQTPLSISLEGLERAISNLEKGIKEIREKHNVYKEVVETRLPTALDTLAGTMLRRDFDKFELQDKALLVKEQALDWKQKITFRWAQVSDKIELFWRL